MRECGIAPHSLFRSTFVRAGRSKDRYWLSRSTISSWPLLLDQWVMEYDQHAAAYATCKLIATFGFVMLSEFSD